MNEDYIYLDSKTIVSASIIMIARYQQDNQRTHVWFSGPQGMECQSVVDVDGSVFKKICDKVKPE